MTRVPADGPDHTAERVALWRALHVQIDSKPHVLIDEVGAQLIADPHWRNRPEMDPAFSKPMRASIVGRARFVEDIVEEQVQRGVNQYVILGAGLDTFAQRHEDLAKRLAIYEIDQPKTQEWKRKRLLEIGHSIPPRLKFVSVDFEAKESWWNQLLSSGFDQSRPAVVVSTGVSMYISKAGNLETLRTLAQLAPGSTFIMTFMLTLELLEPKERAIMEYVMQRARESGTPFTSLYSPEEICDLGLKAGFKQADFVSAEDIFKKYFSNRSDGLRAGHAEAFLVGKT